jgi:peptide/nickel transport system ATP-binding protein
MSCRPDLIIFDEPTTALDVTTQIEVLAAIRDIVDQFNTAAIYITHDLAVVAQMADTIKVLLKGEEVEEAPTEEMLDNPKEEYTKSSGPCAASAAAEAARPKDGTSRSSRCRTSMRLLYRRGEGARRRVSFDIYEGMTVAVVGESGSGKSTTARVITGLLPPSKGEVLFKGEPLPAEIHRPHPRPAAPGADDLPDGRHGAEPEGAISEIIGRPAQFYSACTAPRSRSGWTSLLDLIELEPSQYYNRYPPELSGGQKQRIGIARALAAEPRPSSSATRSPRRSTSWWPRAS